MLVGAEFQPLLSMNNCCLVGNKGISFLYFPYIIYSLLTPSKTTRLVLLGLGQSPPTVLVLKYAVYRSLIYLQQSLVAPITGWEIDPVQGSLVSS